MSEEKKLSQYERRQSKETKKKQGRPLKIIPDKTAYDIQKNGDIFELIEIKYELKYNKCDGGKVLYSNKNRVLVLGKLDDIMDQKLLKIVRSMRNE